MTSATAPTPTPVAELVAVMLFPERDRPQRNSPYRFPVAKTVGKKDAASKVDMSLEGEFLAAGPNFLTRESYELMCQNPFWSRCLKKQVIQVIDQQPENRATGTTADFDSTDAYTLIEGSVDVEWLQRCLAKDDRPDVQEWVSAKIKELKDSEKRD